jgi:hypothetical protein
LRVNQKRRKWETVKQNLGWWSWRSNVEKVVVVVGAGVEAAAGKGMGRIVSTGGAEGTIVMITEVALNGTT